MSEKTNANFEAKENTEYLVSVGKEIATALENPLVKTIQGQDYLFFQGEYQRIIPYDSPMPETIETYTLEGLVDYIKADAEGVFAGLSKKAIVQVADVNHVRVIAEPNGFDAARRTIVRCTTSRSAPKITFDRYMDTDSFQVMLQTTFINTPNRALVLKLAGNLVKSESVELGDDGFSQKVMFKNGVVSVGDVIVKNPVELVPIRTFHEVEQPSSDFVLRFNDRSEVALFEGDGGGWRVQAIYNIKDWLTAELKDCDKVVVIA